MLVKSPMCKVSEKVHAARNRKFDEPERREITSTWRIAQNTSRSHSTRFGQEERGQRPRTNFNNVHPWTRRAPHPLEFV
uniref:Uncharacterized protein n=1 Tax=Bursaphelenchus xylophilus TaxID=6326 RepID=A0A1I7S7P4_BURXY